MYNSLDLLCEKLSVDFLIDEDMRKHSSFKIGGKADRFIEVYTKESLIKLIEFINENKIKYFIIGNGSNILFSDNGFKGVVISLKGEFSDIVMIDETRILCGAGVRLSTLCTFARNNSLSGLEFAYGIPATVGGAVYMNAGAYGGEIKDVAESSFHINGNKEEKFGKDKLDFSYRHSAYSNTNYVITQAIFELKKADKTEIQAKMDKFLNARKEKQPLDFPSAGSTFKRPEGYFAAALIEECGLKGFSIGDAQVSPKHSGFVVNLGNATAKDVLDLVDYIKKDVFEKKQVKLDCEIKMIGF